jgi:hypothetical protein
MVSALGHKRPRVPAKGAAALPLKADTNAVGRRVRFGPKPDIASLVWKEEAARIAAPGLVVIHYR